MIQPWENPRSKFYWFRRRVPATYRRYGMPSEIKFSLETTDWDEAVLRCQEENLKLERQWRASLVGVPSDELSHLQITALAGEFYAETIATHRDEPGRPAIWQDSLSAVAEVKSRRIMPTSAWLHIAYGEEARSFLRRREIRLVGEKFDAFVKAFVAAKSRASQVLLRNAEGDYEPDREASRYPKFETPDPLRKFAALWGEFTTSRKISPATRKKWEPYFKQMIRRVGTDDMSRVTEQHLLDWRDALLASKLSPITVSDGYIAAARSFFGWSKRMKKLPTDPSAEVFVEVSDKHKTKMRGFDHNEAATILAASLAPMNESMTAENAAARRWIPWLCAYTGARVNEVTQLRACDVLTVDGISCIRITPEAGTVKTAKKRTVPLHPHLIEMGFVEFAHRKKGQVPLFYSLARQRNPNRKNPTYTSVGNKLGEWVRGLGIKDPTVAPNHGWRHRFKTEGRRAKMIWLILDTIQGHAPRTEGEGYGEVPPDVMLPEILKYPKYEVAAGERRDGRRGAQKARIRVQALS
jgi:integrase